MKTEYEPNNEERRKTTTMMRECYEKLLAILKDDEVPFWDKAEAYQYLLDNMCSNNPRWFIEHDLKRV